MNSISRLPFRKKWLFAVIILPFFLCLVYSSKWDEKNFQKLTDTLFFEEMCADTLSMHYTLADPAAFGIEDYQPTLPLCGSTAKDSSAKDHDGKTGNPSESLSQRLSRINPGKLNANDAYSYALLRRYADLAEERRAYEYFQDPLSVSSGMHSQLLLLLCEYTFRTTRDVEDYLSLLSQTEEYLSALTDFEKERIKLGFYPAKSSLKKVIKQCDSMISSESLDTGNHFLQSSFADRLVSLSHKISLPKEQALKYMAENDRLLKTVVAPAYEKTADEIFLLVDSCPDHEPVGLCQKEGGREYYELLFRQSTGSDLPVSSQKERLQLLLKEKAEYLKSLIKKNPVPDTPPLYTTLPYTDAKLMLADLKKRMSKDFPLPDEWMTGNDKGTRIKTVSPAMADYCAPAFYLTSPVDDTENNVIYINPQTTVTDLELYTTLAHEGFPGHLYQNVYCHNNFTRENQNKSRLLLWYGGYMEGFAVYVEFISYGYAGELLCENGRKEDAEWVAIERASRDYQLCLYSLLDILIHYENKSRQEIWVFLKDYGIHDRDTADAIYTYIAETPCNYPKYYVGYLEILTLKKQAMENWGTDFSPLAFHTFLLENGPADFRSLSERLAAYSVTSCQS